MRFLERVLGKRPPLPEEMRASPAATQGSVSDDVEVRYEDAPGTLNLGWYYSEEKHELQMAKVSEKDRTTHTYVIGASGSGKTKFLEFLVQQDIAHGNGFAVIDPHGDLVEELKGFLAYYAQDKSQFLAEQVVLIDPTAPDTTVAFNPLEPLPGVSAVEQAQELLSAFRKIWADSWGVRMEDLLRNSLIALGEVGLTLVEVPQFLTTAAFRRAVMAKVANPLVRVYFERFDTQTERARITWTEPVMNKVNALLADNRIRDMFASPRSSFQFRDVMDSGKILLIKLDKGRLQDSADLLGSLLMAKIKMAAFSRSDVPQDQRRPFHLYVDEFQNFASDSFGVVLSEARKYGLSLVMAHQTLAQVSDELRSIILGNTGIQVYFRVNRQDAQVLAKEAFQYSGYEVKMAGMHGTKYWSLGEEWEHYTAALQHLAPRMCYIKHQIQGGLIAVRTVDIESPRNLLGLAEREYQEHLSHSGIGQKYLVSRESVANDLRRRIEALGAAQPQAKAKLSDRVQQGRKEDGGAPVPEVAPDQLDGAAKTKGEAPLLGSASNGSRKTNTSRPPDRVLPQSLAQRPPVLPDETVRADLVASAPKNMTQHRYLQMMIKQIAEANGYRATIEETTPDGLGKVDVSLELGAKRIACEISVTTTDEHEIGNIEKCLRAGYDRVLVCSPQTKTLRKIEALAKKRLGNTDLQKVSFLAPEDLLPFLEEQASGADTGERVKGYKVRVKYRAVSDQERQARRDSLAQVMLETLRRLREKDST